MRTIVAMLGTWTELLSGWPTPDRCRLSQLAAHESPRTTKLYDRTKDELTIGEVERIQL